MKWFNKRAQVEGKLEPAVDAEFRFESGPQGWHWNGVEGGAQAKLTLALILDLIRNGLTATVYGGGEPSITLQAPPDPSYLEEIAAEILGGIKIQVWKFERTFEAAYEWSYSPGGLQPAGPVWTTPDDEGWRILPRSYAEPDPGQYSVFEANAPQPETAWASQRATTETLIASNIYPFPYPALATTGTNMLLLWTYDDVNRPQMQGEEIRYTYYNGSTWSSPAGITADSLQDFAPQVALMGSVTQ